MKKIPRKLLLFVALLALAGGLGIWLFREREKNPWQPLPKGGEVRLYAVTYGVQHVIRNWVPPLPERVTDAVKSGFWSRLFESGGRTTAIHGTEPSIMFWLVVRGRGAAGGISLDDATLQLPGGQILRGVSSGSGSSNAETYFKLVPYRAPTLRLVTKIDGQRFEFETVNPALHTNPPAWTAEPLPQTRKNGDVELTLRALRLKQAENMTTDWVPNSEWAVAVRSEKADAWFDIRTNYEDAGGNVSSFIALLSEPVWKVRATVMRDSFYPFPEIEVRWLGTLQPRPLGERVSSIFPLGSQAGGLELVGVFGAGQYDLKAGAVFATAPPVKTNRNEMIDWNTTTRTMHISLERPAFIVAGWTADAEVFRDEQGQAVRLREQYSIGGTKLTIYDLPDRPVRYGLADRAPLEFEFFVRPPVIPTAKP